MRMVFNSIKEIQKSPVYQFYLQYRYENLLAGTFCVHKQN